MMGRRSGFTLIELAIVLVILSVTMLIALPRLPRSDDDGALRKLAYAVRSTYEDAVFKKKAWRLSMI